MTARLWRPFPIRRLHVEERVHIEADHTERAAIAEALDLIGVDTLTAELTVKPWRQHGVRVIGAVDGRVTQACSLTLEPVEAHVDEHIDLRLHPDAGTSDGEVDVEEADPPERLESDTVDLGAIVLEHFALGLDPYPRAPGAVFEGGEDESEDDDAAAHPFAALAALKNSTPEGA
ncbi:MAG: DUF177 domain-containing protein [Pseudomonadota bacterium]